MYVYVLILMMSIRKATKAKPRKPSWKKGPKKSKASAIDETLKSTIIAAPEERILHENNKDCDEAAENILDNATNFGEQNSNSACLADNDDSIFLFCFSS